MDTKYFLIPANYLFFDFHKLFDEEVTGDKGKVLWQLNGNDPHMKAGDVCYLYYSNLPDHTRRIILRGIVSDGETRDEDNVRCFELEKLETVNWKNTGRIRFTYEDIKAYGVNITRNKRQLRDDRDGDRKLREALEAYYERDRQKLNLAELRTDIEKKLRCAFDSSGNGKNHATFEMENGLHYFETHHFIQQNLCRRKEYTGDGELADSIYDERNLIYLCPSCHRKIHYGRKDGRRKMIQKLYKDNAGFYDDRFSKYAEADGEKAVLAWVFRMYQVD